MYFFSPMCNGVWNKPGTAKHCEDHCAEKMSIAARVSLAEQTERCRSGTKEKQTEKDA